MTSEGWASQYVSLLDDIQGICHRVFEAGAASRDDEVVKLFQRLEQAHADIAGLHDQLEEPQIAQDDYRLNKIELEESRQQVTLLREALRFMHDEKCDYMRLNKLGDPLQETSARLALKALVATDPKEN